MYIIRHHIREGATCLQPETTGACLVADRTEASLYNGYHRLMRTSYR